MPQRQGTILKKCQCANQERCSHKWTLRYWADGRQRERSFGDELDGSGRPRYGSGRRLAQDAQLKIAHDKRARVFIDPKLGSVRFGDECEKWISRHAGTDTTKVLYRGVLRAHVGPVLGDRTLAAVAQARDDVIDLLMICKELLGNSARATGRSYTYQTEGRIRTFEHPTYLYALGPRPAVKTGSDPDLSLTSGRGIGLVRSTAE